MTLMIVPEDGSALDVLALRYSAAYDKTQSGRKLWVEGTLELAEVMLETRKRMPDHQEYGRWLARHQLEQIHPNARIALTGIGEMHRKDPSAALKLLEDNNGLSWRTIWEKKADRPQRPLTRSDKGPPQPVSRRSGSNRRKKAARIPDVMREDYEPPPVRKAIEFKGLTREQVDPDFKGTSTEFATKYGHVNLHTKKEIEHHKRQETLTALLGTIADHERSGREMLAALAAVDPETLREWLSKSGKAAKLQAWCKSIELAYEKLRDISKN